MSRCTSTRIRSPVFRVRRYALQFHQPPDRTACDHDTFPVHLLPDLRHAIDLHVGVPDTLDLRLQNLISFGAGTAFGRIAKCSRNAARLIGLFTTSPVSWSPECTWKTVFAMSIPTGVRFIASLRFAVKIHVILRYALAHVEGLRLTMREGGVHTISLKRSSLHKIRCGSVHDLLDRLQTGSMATRECCHQDPATGDVAQSESCLIH